MDLQQGALILVVDDDEDVRGLLRAALTPRGYRIAEAADGQEALERVTAEVPALIVLDYWMPVLDGAGFMGELCRMLSRRPPVILFTAMHDDPQLARALGVDVYVEKPVDLLRFARLVEATLRGTSRGALGGSPGTAGQERRVRPRLIYRRAVQVRTTGAIQYTPAFTIDVSEAGMGIQVPLPLSRGAYLAIAVQLPDGRRVELDARVRHAADGRVGVQFFAIDSRGRAAIDLMLAEAQAR